MWDDGAIWRGARDGKLILRRCAACAAICHPPLPMCPACQETEFHELVASGRARLHAWFVSTRPDGRDDCARVVAVAELEEGVRFVANLLGAEIGALSEGLPLALCFRHDGDLTLPQFRLAQAAT